jgi:hypothetical protein
MDQGSEVGTPPSGAATSSDGAENGGFPTVLGRSAFAVEMDLLPQRGRSFGQTGSPCPIATVASAIPGDSNTSSCPCTYAPSSESGSRKN